MHTIFNLPETLKDDLDRFREEVERFKNGTISYAEFRSFRVPQGVYEQRETGMFMLRVRFPAGVILPHHLRALADVSRRYGNGNLHVTTRQDIQVHRVPLDNIHPALMELYNAGLSTKGGGGNTVRNITACHNAGVCGKEVFDVTLYVIALTELLLAVPISYQLPRKFKIAFSGCSEDCAGATVNDLGFIAKKRGNELGFAVYVGGGMGAHSRVADRIEEFVSVDKIHLIASAVERVFDKHGNRKNKHRARLRFLIESIGIERFRALYEDELLELHSNGFPQMHVCELPHRNRIVHVSSEQPAEGFDLWREMHVEPQKQDGYYLVHIPLTLGDISADTTEKLADVVEAYGDGTLHTDQRQNLAIRWVHGGELTALHRDLVSLGLAEPHPYIICNTVACAGADTCRLGICLSRGLARAIIREVSKSDLDLCKLGKINIHVSGCPDSCSRHPVGHIGLFGAARRAGDRLAPHYIVQLGGRLGEGRTRLAQGNDAVPARNVPAFMVDFLRAFQDSSECPDYEAFLEAHGKEIAKRLADKYKYVPPFEEDKNYYFDWGAETLFSLAGRGPGECSAGVFDLIEVDLASAHESLREGKLLTATIFASRALLVTQGQEARSAESALALFTEYFIDRRLVDESFRALIENASHSLLSSKPEESFNVDANEVSALVSAVQSLYDNMDQSLRFQPVEKTSTSEAVGQASSLAFKDGAEIKIDQEADFRGTTCPLNYVKTKLLLEQMADGQILSVLLDEEGARNVPESARQDGYTVLSTRQEEDGWRVLIRK